MHGTRYIVNIWRYCGSNMIEQDHTNVMRYRCKGVPDFSKLPHHLFPHGQLLVPIVGSQTVLDWCLE